MIVFCGNPLNYREPDPDYLDEVEAAERAGWAWSLLNFEELDVRRIKGEGEAIYRGWMLPSNRYAELYSSLRQRNVNLINDPAAYRLCHEFPESYPYIQDYTPRSVWAVGPEVDPGPFGEAPIMIKDYVKSRKHDWREACYAPRASEAGPIIQNFVRLQGEDLQGGVVLREFVELEPLGAHPKSGFPQSVECRLFFLNGRLAFKCPYWEEDASMEVPDEPFRSLGARIPSRFFTMDVALTKSGEWIVIELGDGQVAGLPDHADRDAFYASLRP